ncbi:MAG TPA: hypothetical protein VE463_17225 [Blastococcus sp.]|nr:hypothetical protein [Blastococcus sp.]
MLQLSPPRREIAETRLTRPPVHRSGTRPRPAVAGRVGPALAEAFTAVAAAGVLLLLTRRVLIDPLDRIGQVSGLAAIGLRYTVLGLLALGAVVLALRWRGGRLFPLASRLACAAAAGLVSGFVAGGILLALGGTTWPLYASAGDAGVISDWVADVQGGGSVPGSYPPLAIHAMALWADLTGAEAPAALRTAQILGTALFGPVVYLAWRLLLSAPWALAIGVTSSLVLIDPYKPYGPLVLAVLVPVLIAMLKVLRRSASLPSRTLVVRGVLFGVALGVLFLTYSGWFVWSALGVVATAAFVFPWRTAPLRGLTFLGSAVAAFGAVSFPHLLGLLSASGSVRDDYFYFDTYVDPAYIAGWKGDLPGDTSAAWPGTGELAGVGLFSVLLVVGLGVAVWLAGRRTIVFALASFVASAFVMRFWFASQMFGTESVQLYPRTTQQLLYCSLLLVGLAVYFGIERLRLRDSVRPFPVPLPRRSDETTATAPAPASPAVRTAPALIGALAALLVFGLFAGSATADEYMPRNDGGPGKLAYISQLLRQTDGTCPAHSRTRGCADTPADALLIPDRIPAAAPGN